MSNLINELLHKIYLLFIIIHIIIFKEVQGGGRFCGEMEMREEPKV